MQDVKRSRRKVGGSCSDKAQSSRLARIAEDLSSSLLLDEILDRAFESFRGVLPYDRIGLALLSEDGRVVRSIGSRSVVRKLYIRPGYCALLEGSSLAALLKSRRPRIIRDLEEYLREHPQSDSTRRIVAEGMLSSLTFPLFARGWPRGFIFFSSRKRDAYLEKHVESFRRIATLLSLAIEKGCLYAKLKEADAMKNYLLGMAAHDLRNPLTVISAFISLMAEDPANEAMRSQFAVVQRNCQQMFSIIEKVLDASIVQAKGIDLSLGPVNVREFLQQIRDANLVIAGAKSIGLALELPSELPPLTADRARLAQALENLISNAVKYSPAKTTITLSARVVADALELSVADRGAGIPPKEFDRLFRRFGRTSVKPTAGERSIGLGLAIAHAIVKAHRGDIRAMNRPGGGAMFSISLPLRPRLSGRILISASPQ